MKKILTFIFALIAMVSTVSAQDSVPNYLCFEVKAGTTVSLKKVGYSYPNIQYSFDKKSWYEFSGLTVENDCSIYFKGKNPLGFNMSYDNYSSFEVSDEFKCSGNIMTLIDGIGETTEIPRPSLYSFPGCGCFARLFEGCTGLTTAPELPATTMYSYCYYRMFRGCTSLTTAPELPATTLGDRCYSNMFSGCTSLTTAPELPATTLSMLCYDSMFQGCTSLTTAPELLAITLSDGCYNNMFYGCTKLQSITVACKSWTQGCFGSWVKGVSNIGVFICPSDLPKQFGNGRIPNGWQVESKDFYAITSDVFSQVDKSTASVNDNVNVTFTKRDGYNLISATYNGTALSISDYKSSFTMPAANVAIKTDYTPISYAVSCADANIIADKTTGTIDDKVNITLKVRMSEGYKLDKVFVNSTEIAVQNYKASFDIKDYMTDVTIKATYSKCAEVQTDYLCFDVKAGTTVSLKGVGGATKPNIQCSFDKESWADFYELTVENDCCIYFKGKNPDGFNKSGSSYYYFEVSDEFKCSGNIMTLIDGVGETTVMPRSSYCFSRLFEGCPLTTAPELPATTLAEHCYERMFSGCTSLVTAPELPATTLRQSCYCRMFLGCTSLTTAPELPVKNLGSNCYEYMFSDCTSLTTAPELPATTLAWSCYLGMFSGCRSLTTAPELPATNLTHGCYNGMFFECTSLTTAPELPATNLASNCYCRMFEGSNITTAPELPATNLASNCYYRMFVSCGRLTTAPKLPAKTLAPSCYGYMFWYCRSLTTAPELPATTLAKHCYYNMFSGCTSLTTAPELPATTLAPSCYDGMFSMCSSLTTASELPATTLTPSCYDGMFSSCTNLTTAPELPATTLAEHCYDRMFWGCSKLQSITVAFDTWPGNGFEEWVKNFSDKGVFFCPSDLPQQFGVNYIPEGWQLVPISTFYINSPSEFVAIDKTSAMYNDIVNVSIVDRTSEGYKLDKVLVNSTEIAVQDFKASFDMKDYMKDVTITAQYSKIPYTITTDEFSQVANSTATAADVINVTFKQLDGYNLTSATYNGKALTVSNYKSSFTMPAANVEIKTVYAPIAYAISCTDANITADKTTATIEDKVNLTFKNRTSEGYKLDKVLVNSTEIAVKDSKASFDMKDYLKDVTISAQYSQIAYSITTDEYSQVANTTATVDDAIIVTFKQREGFDLASATYNGNPLNIKDYKATFTMPAQDVKIKAVYAEKVYEIEKPSEGVSVSQPSAKAGDEITISVNPKVGYTVHLYVNGAEVALNGNSAVYTMPSGKIEITVKYVVEEKTPVSEIELDNCAVSVFPNPAKSGEEITLKVGGKFDMNNAKIYLYNASGSLVMQIDDVKEYNNLTLQSGVYVGVLVTKGGKKTFRVAVK